MIVRYITDLKILTQRLIENQFNIALDFLDKQIISQEIDSLQDEILEVLYKFNLPNEPFIISRIAYYMLKELENGRNVKTEDVIQFVLKDIKT